MTPKQREKLAGRLKALRDAIRDAGPAKLEPTRTDATQVGVADEDAQALAEMMQILASTRNKAASATMGKIVAALRRLDEDPDGFGECEECGEAIASARLELMPYATLCTGCQAEKDPRRGRARKSLTDFGD